MNRIQQSRGSVVALMALGCNVLWFPFYLLSGSVQSHVWVVGATVGLLLFPSAVFVFGFFLRVLRRPAPVTSDLVVRACAALLSVCIFLSIRRIEREPIRQVARSIHSYYSRNHRYPSDIRELVPGYIRVIPSARTLLPGCRFAYRLTAEGDAVLSVDAIGRYVGCRSYVLEEPQYLLFTKTPSRASDDL